jgi:hypothetical protein
MPVTKSQQRLINKWQRFKNDLSNLNTMKRSINERFCDDMYDILNVHFGECNEGMKWKRELSEIRHGNQSDIEAFAARFFRQEYNLPQRKQPIDLLRGTGHHCRRADDEDSEITEG